MKKRTLFTFLSVVVVIVASLFMITFINKKVQPTDVYIFSRNMAENTVITEDDITKKAISKDAVSSTMAVNKSEIVGKIIDTKVYSGEYVIKDKLKNKDDKNALSDLDLSNYRKVTIPVDNTSAIGGNIKKGDKVDLVYVNTGSSESKKFTYSTTFMQDVIVFNVIDDSGKEYVDNTETTKSSSDSSSSSSSSSSSTSIANVILAVKTDQVEEIEARLNSGKITVVGRFSDSVNSATNGYTIGNSDKVKVSDTNPEK